MKRRTFLKAAVATAAAAIVVPQTVEGLKIEESGLTADQMAFLDGLDCPFELRVEHRPIPIFGSDISRTVYISNDGGMTWEMSEVEFEFADVGHGPFWTEVEIPL